MTREISQADLEAALQDPKAFFAEPQDIADYPQLSREEKPAILRRWKQDALRLSASDLCSRSLSILGQPRLV